jgi:hypothetical protein
VQEDYLACLCERAKSGSGRKAPNNRKLLCMQLLIFTECELSVNQNECRQSVNDFRTCKYGN